MDGDDMTPILGDDDFAVVKVGDDAYVTATRTGNSYQVSVKYTLQQISKFLPGLPEFSGDAELLVTAVRNGSQGSWSR